MREGTYRLGMGGMLDHQPWVSHLLWLSDEAGAHSEGGKVVTHIRVEHLCDNRMRMLVLDDFRNFKHKGIRVIY